MPFCHHRCALCTQLKCCLAGLYFACPVFFYGRRVNGRTDWIGIENVAPSVSSGRLLIKTDLQRPLATLSRGKVTTYVHSPGVYEVVGLEHPGSNVVIYSQANGVPDPSLIVEPVPVKTVRVCLMIIHPMMLCRVMFCRWHIPD